MDAIKESFDRCDEAGEFADTFYDIFMSKSGEVKLAFKNTDFSKQKKLLRATVEVLVSNEFNNPRTKKILENIAKTHNRTGYNIEARFYKLWLDSLCETIARHDPAFSDDLEMIWRNTMQESINFIFSKY